MPVLFVNDHVNVSWSFRLDLDLQTSNQSLKKKTKQHGNCMQLYINQLQIYNPFIEA